jgi:iron complex outermembrane receptor protein
MRDQRKGLHLLLCFGLIAIPLLLAADSTAGRIAGVVRDQSGAPVPGARIGIRNPGLGVAREVVTDGSGKYSLDALPEGRYQVEASSRGLAPATRGDLAVSAGGVTEADFALRIEAQKATVDVTAAAASATPVYERLRTNDSAGLLDDAPGVSLLAGGGVSSLPAIHGLADERVAVLVNGMQLQSACANHMNPAASYIDPANVGRVSVIAGITPVSLGGDSIGGTVALDSPEPEFAKPGRAAQVHGALSASHRTNGVVNGQDAQVSVTTGNLSIAYTGAYVHANDYKNGSGAMVMSTFYEATNHALELALRHGSQLFTAAAGYQYIPQEGFANARMDMAGNQGRSLNLHYQSMFRWGKLEARGYWQNTQHLMNVLRDKLPGMNMPMYTNGTNLGETLGLEVALSPRSTLRVGQEYRRFTLNDWWPPVSAMVGSMGPGTLVNMNDGKRGRIGAFAEFQTRRGHWTATLGVRGDVVRMDAGNVTGYNNVGATTGSAAYFADARDFNAVGRQRTDGNVDLTAASRYAPGANFSFDLGYARKTRSPSLYERYLWVKRSAMSANMNGWFGDANGYTGNLNLKPEVANTLSATAGWHGAASKRWELRLTR